MWTQNIKVQQHNLVLLKYRYTYILNFAFLYLETRNLNHLDNFKKGLRELLPNIRNGTENRKKLAELLVGIHKSPFYYDKFYIMLNVRQKEVETVETIIYFKDLSDEVERVVDSHDNPCMAINEFAIVYELDILPKDPSTLGI